MLKQIITKSIILVVLLLVSILAVINLKTLLFVNMYLLMAVFIGLGVLAGITTAALKRITHSRNPAFPEKRHTLGSFFQHWGTSVGILLLFITGLFMKINPGIISSNIHFTGVLITLLFGFYFLIDFFTSQKYIELLPDLKDIFEGTIKKYILRTPWKDQGKYQASQKSAFLAFIVLGSEVLISGLIKTVALLTSIPDHLLSAVTLLHDVSGLLLAILTVVHIVLVFIPRANLQLLASWFTGVDVQKSSKQD